MDNNGADMQMNNSADICMHRDNNILSVTFNTQSQYLFYTTALGVTTNSSSVDSCVQGIMDH